MENESIPGPGQVLGQPVKDDKQVSVTNPASWCN